MSFWQKLRDLILYKPWVEAKEIHKVLVIKHGALGDFIQATGAFRAIRSYHPNAHIVLLTTPPYKEIADKTGWFNEIWEDKRPSFWKIQENYVTIHRIRDAGFDRIYDLQTSTRSNFYFRALGRKKPEWSGNIDWCSHPHFNPQRAHMHTLDRLAEQLSIVGIKTVPKPTVAFLKANIAKFHLPKRYALIVAGGSHHRQEKRWHVFGYQELANWLVRAKGITPIFLGTKAEKWHVNDIMTKCKDARNLTDQTSFDDIAEMARGAVFAIGSDTGPMHLIAAAGCPSIVLFSSASDPEKCKPWGKAVFTIQEDDLTKLDFMDVRDVIEESVTLDTPRKRSKPA